MRTRFFGIINLLIINMYLLAPAVPYIEYSIRKDFIEKNLCVERNNPVNDCHGKCYLHEQIEKQNKPKENSQDNNNIIPDNKIDDHLRIFPVFPVLYPEKTGIPASLETTCFRLYIPDIFIPPRG